MRERELINLFSSLAADSIRKQLPGRWGDMEMADVPRRFYEAKDFERGIAIQELMLRSPEVSDSLYYSEFYFDLQHEKSIPKALEWILPRYKRVRL